MELIDHALRKVPGEGAAGVRRGYLWMLVGDQQGVKPDRMVLRWLARIGFHVDVDGARSLLDQVSESLTAARPIPAGKDLRAQTEASRTARETRQ